MFFKLSAPAEDSTPFANSPAVAQASPIDNQDEKQVNAGEEANKAMEKTEAELGNKVRIIKSLNWFPPIFRKMILPSLTHI